MGMAWHGHGMASVNQIRPHCVNQMGKTHSKPLGHGMAGERHGRGMLCVNRPLLDKHLEKIFLLNAPDKKPVSRRCGAEEEPSAHVSCECEAFVSHSHI